MNLAALKTELAAGHPGTGPYDADHATAAAQLNAANRTRLREPTVDESAAWLASSGIAAKIDAATASGDTAQPVPISVLVKLATASVISAADRTALQTTITESVSRATEIGLGYVKPGHVEMARSM